MISEAVQLKLVENIPQIMVGISSIAIAYFTYRTHEVTKDTNIIAKKTEENTNHLKDELVAEVRKASFAAGQKDQSEKQ
jgi:hypothetical protein